MKYFAQCKNLEELKKEFRRLAMLHHPDRGGDQETMKAINNEYDAVFPALKLKHNQTAAEPTHETAESTRREFYTQNGFKGRNYDSNLSTKDVAQRIREYVKTSYPDCKFSVTTHCASMCSSIHVALMSGPYAALVNGADYVQVNQYYIERDDRLTDWARAVLLDVNDCIKSYHWDDCDGMIDYFDVNFYFDLDVGKWDKPYTVTNKPRKISAPKTESKAPAPAETNADQPQTAPAQLPALRVEFNTECDGIEVYFPSKPSQETRDALKVAGYRWHSVKKCWFAKRTEEHLQALRKIEEAA